MFHPSGPNLRLSWMLAWKKASPQSSFFHSALLVSTPSKSSSLTKLPNERRMLDLKPFGGSFVIFTPFWSTATGKYSVGNDVRYRRKSGWMPPPPGDLTFSCSSKISLSSSGIHDFASMPFCRTTQSPVLYPFSISALAKGP